MRSLNRLRLPGALALALLLALPGCGWLSPAEENDLLEKRPRSIYALGRLEPATGVIDIRATPGDRLKKLFEVAEGEIAPEDGVLGLLSSYDMGKAQLSALLKKRELALQKHVQQVQLAKAQLAQAIASRAQVQAKLTELILQRGKLEALRVARDLAEEEFRRLEKLRSTDPELVTPYQIDKQKNRRTLASEDYKIARDTHSSATTATELAVAAAEANVEVAEIMKQQAAKNFEKLVVDQEIEVAREVLKRSILVAPHESPAAMRKLLMADAGDGIAAAQEAKTLPPKKQDIKTQDTSPDHEKPQYTVLKVHLRQGEVVTQGPILQLGDLRKMVCVAEVHESDVKELEVGQTVTLRSPAFSGRFADGTLDPKTGERTGGIRGRVVRIGQMVVSPGLLNRNPLSPVDRSVVEVRIEIDPPERGNPSITAIAHASKHVGLQVTIKFDSQKADGGPRSPSSRPDNVRAQ